MIGPAFAAHRLGREHGVEAGRDFTLHVHPRLPANTHLSAEAPWSVRIECDGRVLAQRTEKSDKLPLSITVPGRDMSAAGTWVVSAAFAICTESERGLCAPVHMEWSVPVRNGDEREAALRADVSPP